MATRYFTLDEAQEMLPKVREILGQALQLHAHLRASLARLTEAGHEISWTILRGEEQLSGADDGSDEDLARARMIYGVLREMIARLEALGVEVKSVTSGLVDFRSWCDGEREVLLCFRLGETEIAYFHGLEAGFSGREPIEGHDFTATPSDPERASAGASTEPPEPPSPAHNSAHSQ